MVEKLKTELDKDWYNQTTLHPLGLTAVLILGTALLAVPRRYASWTLFAMACFVAPAQRLVVAEFDFNMLRLMVLFGLVRILVRGEFKGFRWTIVDFVFLAYLVAGFVAYCVLWATGSAIIYRMGWVYDGAGMYFLFRVLLRDWGDVDAASKSLAILAIPVAAVFIIEWFTQRNMFAVFGGVREITMIRHGRMRCQGAFSHPIMAGTFWAALLPLIAVRWWRGPAARPLVVAGTIAALIITTTTASSGPVLSVIAVLIGAAAFFLRPNMREMRWALLFGIIALHIVMNKPVWHLVARMNVVGGSTGWHRFHLIDQAIRRVGEWAAFGTKSTAHWGWGLFDVTNEYVLQAVRGGLLTLLLFVALIALSFRAVGRMWRAVRGSRYAERLAWALGVSVFVHVISFIGASYFGQIHVAWYFILAAIASMYVATPGAQTAPQRAVAPVRPPRPGHVPRPATQ